MNLFYREFGTGQPVIIIHGLLGMSDIWIPVAKKIAEKYKVVLPDLRNHGNSPHSAVFNLNELTNDIIELYHRMGFTSAILMGHSLGGRIAISAALRCPDLFDKIIILDIAPRQYSGNKSITNLIHVMNRIDLGSKRSMSEIDELLACFITDLRVRQLVLKNIFKNSQGKYMWKVNLKIITENIETLMTPVFEDTEYVKPALFLKGGLSDFIEPDDYKLIYKYFPAAEIEVIPNAGHWLHADEPELVLDKVQSFMNS